MQLLQEDTLRRTYNDYRRLKGLEPVDFSDEFVTKKVTTDDKEPARIKFCVNCLLDCFKSKPMPDGSPKALIDELGNNSRHGLNPAYHG